MIDLVRHIPELSVEKYYIFLLLLLLLLLLFFHLFKIEKKKTVFAFSFCFVLQLLWPPEVFLSVHYFPTILSIDIKFA